MVLTEKQLGVLIALKKEGLSGYLVSQRLKEHGVTMTIQGVNKVYKKFLEFKGQQQPNKRGRQSQLTEDVKRYLKQEVQKDKSLTAVDLFRRPFISQLNLSVRTIQRYLLQLGFKCKTTPTKNYISSTNISLRYEWGLTMNKWRPAEINTIIFSDESKLFSQKQGRMLVRYLKGRKLHPRYFKRREMYHGGKEIMVWGCISYNGPLRLVRINGTLTAQSYIQLLEENLIPIPEIQNKTAIFQQDNCKAHDNKDVASFLKKTKIKQLKWPSQSPDMNIIENLWAYVKNYLHDNKEKISSKEDVWKFAQRAFFSEGSTTLIRTMYDNYSKRIECLLKEEGKITKY
ncbi:hypothetical protein ABPG72_019819 [Tetrahymena utriculariae]